MAAPKGAGPGLEPAPPTSKEAAVLPTKRWKELVRTGRLLVLQGAAGRLELGRIAQQIEPAKSAHGGDRRSSPAPAELEAYAQEIDLASATLREYRDVMLRWEAGGKDAPETSWSVLRELAYQADPHAAFKAIGKAEGRVTIITLRAWLGKKSAGVRSTSPVADKVEQARRLLADPEVMRGAMSDHTTRQATTRAVSAVERAQQPRSRPSFPREQRGLEIAFAPFFRSLADIGGAGFLSSLREAETELGLLIEHDVQVPPEVMDGAEKAAAAIAEHLSVLRMRAGLEAWMGAET